VQRTLATHLRDRDKEREQHKHDEAVQHFNALLADLVSGTTFTCYIRQVCLICKACTVRFCLPMEEFLYGHLHCSASKKCTLVQALGLCTGHTAYRGSRGIAVPFHDHDTRRG
jgi:hypothetical protein